MLARILSAYLTTGAAVIGSSVYFYASILQVIGTTAVVLFIPVAGMLALGTNALDRWVEVVDPEKIAQ